MDRKIGYLIEEFTRFGGGQVVFENVHSTMTNLFETVRVVTDKEHSLLPGGIKAENLVETSLLKPSWESPLKMLPKVFQLKKELKNLPQDVFVFNNHPNVFIYNATINFGHELFGFMGEEDSKFQRIVLSLIKNSRLYEEYRGSYFLTNGEFTSRHLKSTFAKLGVAGVKVQKLDLPVNLPQKIQYSDKTDTVLTFGRISRDKMLHRVIEIAKFAPGFKFIISGRALEKEMGYVRELMSVMPENVSIVLNPDMKTKDHLFRSSKVYLHTKMSENYGISVAEAISYGCYPIVPLRSGAYEDILENGKLGKGYLNNEEAAVYVQEAMNTSVGELNFIFSTRNRFSKDYFVKNLVEKISQFLGS